MPKDGWTSITVSEDVKNRLMKKAKKQERSLNSYLKVNLRNFP